MENTEQHNEPKLNIEGFSEADLKRNPFKTPEGYFENLTPRVMDSVRSTEEKVESTEINWWRVLMPGIGFSAMVFAVWFLSAPTGNNTLNFDQVVASMSLEELDQFAEFETEDLLAYGLVTSDDIEIESDFSEEELINYLLDEEEMELNTIYEELDI
ncbi:MAG TPA: hypothetical protein DCR04_05405 [Flavobacteriales bacterium]|nr:hypothetical protein [Flavobacteriales bacterium]